MAMALDPRLSPHAQTANAVDYIQLRTLMEEHFRSFPDGCVLASENVNISEICTHIAEHRICPSLFTDYQCPALYHPEFIQRYDQILWLPRTWICRAFQRSILPDGGGAMACRIPNCCYAHAGFWSTSEQLTWRALVLRTNPHNLGLLYHLQPTPGGTRPMERISSASALQVLRTQPFLTEYQWREYRYRSDIPQPPTYSGHISDVPILRAAHWTAINEEPYRNRRSTTPRRSTRSTTPVRSFPAREQELVPNRDNTPPRQPPDHHTSYPWLDTNTESHNEPQTNRWGSRNREPTPAPQVPQVPPPPTPRHYDVWGTYTNPAQPAQSSTGFDPFSTSRPIAPTPGPMIEEEEDSDGLELPPAHLTLSRAPPQPTPAQDTTFHIQPNLVALANTKNYDPVAISGSANQHYLADVPAVFLQHLFPTSPAGVSLANEEVSWQVPSNILHQIFYSTQPHPQHSTQQSITPWGLFTKMGMRDTFGQHTHFEQSLTIPFATRTASPELAIIRWLVHQKITHERQRVTRDYLNELTRNPNLHPGSYFNLVARDFITAAANVYRTTIHQHTPATDTFRNIAQEILTFINDTTHPSERLMVTDPNITIDPTNGRLVFR